MADKLNAEETLAYLVGVITLNLEELSAPPADADKRFVHGERTAYVECLEIVQERWKGAADVGLKDDVERRYPV